MTRAEAVRRTLSLTQDDVAAHLGVSTSYVSLLETKQRVPSYQVAHRLSLLLDVQVHQLFEDVQPEEVKG